MTKIEVTRTYLELKGLDQLRPAKIEDDPLIRLARVPAPSVALIQRLYREVGADYHWVDRWTWTAKQWEDWVQRPGYGLWVLSYDGDVAGFFELKWDEAGAVEIELIGLVTRFHGRGLGGHLLTAAVEIAFAIGANRVWLHTCTLDHPAALPNYLARGFTPFRTERYEVVR
ncbi:MAG TPA: GNAT family N-acetyltransferase [Gemmatimonadales bacterium]|nr:GNAT family N-acetyltransferase [Gemmatimonadales bacterium]